MVTVVCGRYDCVFNDGETTCLAEAIAIDQEGCKGYKSDTLDESEEEDDDEW